MIDKDTFNSDVDFNGTKGLVFIGDKIIVYRRDTKTSSFPLQIDLPGGGRENNESPFETFKREVREEFGLTIEREDISYSKKYQSILDPSKEAFFMATRPLNTEEKDIIFGDEGLEFFLISPQDFVNLKDGVKRQQDKVAEYLRGLK
jgi:8-oxo-dGTP diphosphatase